MEQKEKEFYTEPVLVAHELLRDITTNATSGLKLLKETDGTFL